MMKGDAIAVFKWKAVVEMQLYLLGNRHDKTLLSSEPVL